MTEVRWPDFVLRCEVCDGKLITRYHWIHEQGQWVPVAVRGLANVTVRTMRGAEVDDRWLLDLLDTETAECVGPARPVRYHHEISCGSRNCRNAAPADSESLRVVFTLIASAVSQAERPSRKEWVHLLADLATTEPQGGLSLTLAGLRAALAYNNRVFRRAKPLK